MRVSSFRARAARTKREGFSLVEIMVLTALFLVAIGGLAGAALSLLRLSRCDQERLIADEALRSQAGRMRLTAFDQIFRQYNGTAADDAGGVGTGPGAAFEALGLSPQVEDGDGLVGRIVFPVLEVAGVERLREDVQDERLGMADGLDLNGDGDAADDATDSYQVLPVRLILEWKGASGNSRHELDLLLTE